MICIYSQNNTEYSKNGDAVLTPISCTLAVTINSSWQLSLEHPYDAEERYKYIKVGAVIRADINCIRELGSVQQRFRIYQVNKGDNSISAIAFPIGMEASYDAPIDNLNIDGTAQQAITALQAYTQKYTLSTDVTKTARASYANTNLITALASSDASSFLRTWGGELLYDNLNLKIRNRLGDNVAGEHRILYGKNLSSVSHELDDSGLITRIYPISIDGIRLNGTGYVDSNRASQYPVRHARYMQAPYNLIDQNAGSNSRTAVQTRTAIAAITNSASTTSHTACDNALDAGIQPEYIKSIRSDIISAVQTMALNGVVSASLYNAAASVIASSMSWLNELEQPEWSWRGDAETGYWYGNDDSYAKNMYVKISKTWSYFGDDGIWQEPRDDKGTWDWYQDSTGKKYGNFNKYFAHNEYVYITMEGTLTCYWFNEEGWYESEYTEESSWTWHGSGTAEDPYWFGEDGAGDNAKKYAHDCWLFIDGVYYFFDSYGYYDGSTKFEDYRWDWVESDERFWFGNAEDKTYGATYLTSQWCKINGDWYYFDANGYAESANNSIARTTAYFTSGMAALATVVSTQKSALYTLLYTLMTEWCQSQYAQGVDLPRLTISIDMVDLSKTTEYAGYENLESVKLGDSVMCEDYKHNISTSDQRVIGLIYDCIRNYNNNVVLGSPALAVSQMLSGSSANNAVAGGFDTSAIETALTTQGNAIASLQNGKQDKLTAGANISIINNVISATGGTGLQYWHETPTRFYREGIHEGLSADGYIYTSCNWNNYVGGLIQGYEYQKLTEEPAIMAEFGYGLNQAIVIVGLSENAVKWQWRVRQATTDWLTMSSYPSTMYNVSFMYNGATWYASIIKVLSGYDSTGTVEGLSSIDATIMPSNDDAGAIYLAKHFVDVDNATDKVAVVMEIGTQSYILKYGGEGKTFTSIDIDGNAVFKEVTTDAGSLTSQMAAKQNALTAGANIQINGDTISATDTTYIAGDNIDITNGVISSPNDVLIGTSEPTSATGNNGNAYYKYNVTSETTEDQVTLPTFVDDQSTQVVITDFENYTKIKFVYTDINQNIHSDVWNISVLPQTTNPQWGQGGDIWISNGYNYIVCGRDSNGLWIKECGNHLQELYACYDVNDYEVDKEYVKIEGEWYQASSGGGGGGGKITLLASPPTGSTSFPLNTNITLAEAITNFDCIMFCPAWSGGPAAIAYPPAIYPVAYFKALTNRAFTYYGTAGYNDVGYVNDTTVQFFRNAGETVCNAIYGIKY